jgi:hypothetical protein
MSNVGDGTGFPPDAPPRGKLYLGDGVYLTFLDYGILLTTENGIVVTNRIVLEPEVYMALVQYMKRADG